jgi:CelD/BcsL family acetyltransferase involved in cellulose biosynthesis
MTETREYRSLDHEDVVSAWDALESAGACPGLFGTRPWVSAWAGQFGDDLAPLVLVSRSGADLLGMAVLFIERDGRVVFPVNFLSPRAEFLGGVTGVDLLADAFVHYVASSGGRAFLRGLPADSPTLSAIRRALPGRGIPAAERPGRVSPYIDIDGSWDDYLAGRPRKVTHEWERKTRKLEAAGRVSVASFEDGTPTDRLIEEFISVESRSWKERNGTSIGARGVENFYRGMARGLADTGAFRPFWIELDGETIAFLLGAVHGGTYFAMKTSYDERFASLSPGVRLFREAVKHAFGAGLARFDFLGQRARWKDEWANGWREHVDVSLYEKGLRGSLARAVDVRVRPAVRALMRGRDGS